MIISGKLHHTAMMRLATGLKYAEEPTITPLMASSLIIRTILSASLPTTRVAKRSLKLMLTVTAFTVNTTKVATSLNAGVSLRSLRTMWTITFSRNSMK